MAPLDKTCSGCYISSFLHRCWKFTPKPFPIYITLPIAGLLSQFFLRVFVCMRVCVISVFKRFLSKYFRPSQEQHLKVLKLKKSLLSCLFHRSHITQYSVIFFTFQVFSFVPRIQFNVIKYLSISIPFRYVVNRIIWYWISQTQAEKNSMLRILGVKSSPQFSMRFGLL